MDTKTAKAIQSRLSRFYDGPIDGAIGAVSLAAMFDAAAARHLGPVSADMGHQALVSFASAGISTPLRYSHFLAQAAHESQGFLYFVEIWGPTPAQAGYEGRRDLGNIRPGDGKMFRGRGIFDITGRDNYTRMGARLGVDLIAHPEKAADPAIAVRIACMFWTDHNLNALADADDIVGITRSINGGLNGFADRQDRLKYLKGIFL